MTLFGVCTAVVIMDLANTLVLTFFLQTVFPIQGVVPWASAEPSYQIVLELLIYMFSILNSLHQNSNYSFWVYMSFAPITGVLCFYLKTGYCKIMFAAYTIIQATIVASCIILSIQLQRLKRPRNQYFVITFLLILIIYLFLQVYSYFRQKRILLTKDSITSSTFALKWLWALETQFQFNAETHREILTDVMINYETLYMNHSFRCIDSYCNCKTPKVLKLLAKGKIAQNPYEICKKLKVLIVEIFLNQVITTTQSEVSIAKQNDTVGLLVVFQWFKINKNYLSCAYNITKFHDCSKCSIQQCFQYYTLKRLIQQEISQKQSTDESQRAFQKMIYFESNFRHYQKIIESTIQKVTEYWQIVQKSQLDIFKSENSSQQIVTNYQRFNHVYSHLTKECGEIILTESLAWRFHQEVLNFEYEAAQNLEKIKQIMTKQRLQNKNQFSSMSSMNFKNSFIIISVNPDNFQNILAVSKSLVKMCGFSEDFLLSSTLRVLLPSTIVDVHEAFIKKYLKTKNIDLNKVVVSNQWMQKVNGTLKPVSISIMPKYDSKDGLRLIGILEPIKNFEIFEQQIPINNIYGIFTDVNLRIRHVTENCIQTLQMNEDILSLDLYIYQIFQNLPEEFQNEMSFITLMNLDQCFSLDYQDKMAKRKMNLANSYRVQVFYKERTHDGICMSREFLFTIIGEAFDSTNSAAFKSLNTIQSLNQSNLENSSGQQLDLKQTYTSESKSMDMNSMSSQSSGSSSAVSQDTQINNIKGSIEFNKLPQSLVRYRIWLLIGFTLIMTMGFVLLGVNLYTKDKYLDDLSALQTEKRLRNNFSSAKLALLMIYSSMNFPSTQNVTQQIPLQTSAKRGYGLFYQAQLKDVLNRLQSALVLFAQNSIGWDETFVEKVNDDLLNLSFITEEGNSMNYSQTFYKSITLYQGYLEYLSNSNVSDYKMGFNIYDVNTLKEFQTAIKVAQTKQQTILEYIYYIFFNGSGVLLDKMYEIDKYFMVQLVDHGQKLINVLLIIAICCACLTFLIFSINIPYYLGVQQLNEKIIKYIHKTDKQVITGILELAIEFKEFIEKNRFLNMNGKKKLQQTVSPNIQNGSSLLQRNIVVDQEEEFKDDQYQKSQQMKIEIEGPEKKIKNEEYDIQSQFEIKKARNARNASKGKISKKVKGKLQNEMLEDNSEKDDEEKDLEIQEQAKNKASLDTQEHLYLKKIAFQSQKRKFISIGIITLIGSIMSVFFIFTYFISKQVLQSYTDAFQQFDLFYNRGTCVTESHFILQKSILLNQSIDEDTHNGFQYQRQIDECSDNEAKYRLMKKDSTGLFATIVDTLDVVDSVQICDFLITNKAAGKECYTDANGVIQIGLEQLMQYLQSGLNQQKINYQNELMKKDQQTLEKLFLDKSIITNVGIYYTYMQWIFRNVQVTAKSILDSKMSENFVQIIAIYSVFEIVVILLALLCIYRLIDRMKRKLHQIRFMLKLLPQTEILKHKSFLEKINTKLL